MLGGIRQRLGDQVIGGHFHRLGEPLGHLEAEIDRERSPAGQHLQGRPQAGLGQDRRMKTARDLTQLVQHGRQSVFDSCQLGPHLGQLTGNAGPGNAQLQGQRDELLLSAIVQVALDPPPRLIARRDDSPAGRHQVGAPLDVGDGGGDQLGEPGDPLPGAPRLGSGPVHGDHHQAPHPAVHDNRVTGHGPDIRWPGDGSGPAGSRAGVLDTSWLARLQHRRGHVVPARGIPGPDLQVLGPAAPGRQPDDRAVRLIPEDLGGAGVRQLADLLGYRREDRVLRGAFGDECSHPAQGGLLAGQLLGLRAMPPVLVVQLAGQLLRLCAMPPVPERQLTDNQAHRKIQGNPDQVLAVPGVQRVKRGRPEEVKGQGGTDSSHDGSHPAEESHRYHGHDHQQRDVDGRDVIAQGKQRRRHGNRRRHPDRQQQAVLQPGVHVPTISCGGAP